MRGRPARVLGILALGAVMASTSACISGFRDADTKACDDINSELEAISDRREANPRGTAAAVEIYEKASASIAVKGQKAGGDIGAAADEISDALNEMADSLRRLAAGLSVAPRRHSLSRSWEKLRIACDS
ncbi:hypothetical protein [Actinomadura sp. HBU206391]|uniref:hypothetical protein n=1 Tax=Actinomadura sp. HBU206391 TaxID=2731692 RepID=UPI001650AC1B|nr:hypothetical protein [Actinomadura sp. HBU206391]MBC6457403.1 hypothetical protein [Actinomadura sp. HBU206391]